MACKDGRPSRSGGRIDGFCEPPFNGRIECALAEFSREAGHILLGRIAGVEAAMGILQRQAASSCKDALGQLSRSIEMLKGAATSAMWYGRAWQKPQFVRFDLADLTARLRRQYARRRFLWQLPRRLVIWGDPHLIERAVVELFENARRFVPRRGGRIGVRMSRRGAGSHVVIEVCDNGPGVPAAMKRKVFRPYHSQDCGHFGLGLSIVRRVAAVHGGTAQEVGRPGCGARFRIVLPQRNGRTQ
ncbi:MAG: ATP-binding protein [Planctomycetaceae bacterium]|nr:ATP-binding protein [Planctomycetaceae bacterium]